MNEYSLLKQKASQHYQQGTSAAEHEQYFSAQMHLEEAREIYLRQGNMPDLANTLTNLGAVYSALDNFEDAISVLNFALTLHHNYNEEMEAITYYNLMVAFKKSGFWFQAYDNFITSKEALEKVGKQDLVSELSDFREFLRINLPSDLPENLHKEFDEAWSVVLKSSKLADEYEKVGNAPIAIEYWESAVTASRKLISLSSLPAMKVNLVKFLNRLGVARCRIGTRKNEIIIGCTCFREAIAIAKDINSLSLLGDALTNLGRAHYDLRRPELAIKDYNEAYELRIKIGDARRAADILTYLALTFMLMDDRENAIRLFQNALNIFVKAGDSQGEKYAKTKMEQIISGDKFDLPYFYYNDAENEYYTIKTTEDFYKVLAQAHEHMNSDNYEKALKIYEYLLTVVRDYVQDKSMESSLLIGLAFSYRRLGNISGAILAYQKAVFSARNTSNLEFEARALNNLGVCYIQVGQRDAALKFLGDAEKIRRKLNDNDELGQTVYSISGLVNDKSEQIRLKYEALSLVNPKVSSNYWHGIYNDLRSLLSEEDKSDLRKMYKDVIVSLGIERESDSIPNPKRYEMVNLFEDLDGFGIIVPKADKYSQPKWSQKLAKIEILGLLSSKDKAIKELTDVINEIESERFGILFDDHRKSYLQEQWKVYDTLIEYLIHENRYLDAVAIIEKVKTRSLGEIVSLPENLPDNVSAGIREKYRKAKLNYLNYGKQLTDLQKANAKPEPSLLNSVQERVMLAGAQLDEIHREMLSFSPGVNPSQFVNPVDQSRISDICKSAYQAYVMYWLGTNYYGIFVLIGREVNYYSIEKKDQVQVLISDFKRIVAANKSVFTLEIDAVLSKLYTLLIHPLMEMLTKNNIQKLVIIPYYELHLLPFHAAKNEKDEYLNELFDISYAPSFTLLDHCLSNPPQDINQSSILALANPDDTLIFANLEGIRVGENFEKSMVLQGRQATINALLENGYQHSYLHIACHGGFEENQEDKIGLQLSPTQQYPSGFLTVRQIINNLRLQDGTTVVLSACDTARVILESTDEYYGLNSSFIVAGASRVIGTLWIVDDISTAWLMNCYYNNLRVGMSSSTALQNAQIQLRELKHHEICNYCEKLVDSDPDRWQETYFNMLLADAPDNKPYSNPFYWAAYISVGYN